MIWKLNKNIYNTILKQTFVVDARTLHVTLQVGFNLPFSSIQIESKYERNKTKITKVKQQAKTI